VEELNELSLELIHAVNKVNKNNLDKISNEIKDVEKYLNILKKYLDSQS
jgi:NTP pyrophosphatase (non-canonical NTP hydrolase)